MNIVQLKKMFAGVSASAIMLSQVATAMAAYSDVPAGVWFGDAVAAFVAAGHLDSTKTMFHGGDNANRAEFVKLVVEVNGGVIGTAPAVPSFDDVATGAWYYKYFEDAGEANWVRGDGSCYGKHPCYARPSANINRAEAAAIIVRAFSLESSGSAPQFVDNPTGKWYTADIQTAADNCVLQGDDSTGRVRPGDNMNRAEMVVMLNRVNESLTYGKDCGTSTVSVPKVKSATAISSMVVEVAFNTAVDETAAKDKSHYTVTGSPEIPVDSVKLTSRDTVEVTLTSAMDAGHTYTLTIVDMMTTAGKKFSDSTTFAGYSAIVQGDGILEVTLSSKNPVGDTVPMGAQGIVFTSVDLTATSDDVVLENITVLHEGFGDSADFSGVYGVVDGARVTRKRTIDTQSYTATLRFTKPLVVMAGKTVTLQLAGDLVIGATVSSEHALTVELPTDLTSNAKSVKGNFPLKGKSFRVAAVSSGTVSITYRSVTPTTAKVGNKAVTVGKWELAINSAEDQTIYSMTLQNDGTAGDGDFTNIAIKRSDGTVLTQTVASTVGDYVTLVFDPPFTVLEGDRITMSVIADIVGGAAKNIKFHFDETGDIFAVGSLYGYGVNGQLYGSTVVLDETTVTPSTVTIDAGQFTISIDGPVTQQYTRKDKNAVLANVWFETGGEDVDVEELYVLVQGTTSTGAAFINRGGNTTAADAVDEALEQVELRNTTTGRTISGVKLTTSASHSEAKAVLGTGTGAFQIYRFDDFVVHGKEKYEFRVNFIDNSGVSTFAAPANGDKFRIHICGEATHTLSSNNLVTNTTGCTMGGFFVATSTNGKAWQMKIKGVSTNDRIGDYRPGGTISGNAQEIKTAGLTISGKQTATTDTTVSNAKNVTLMRFEARASDASDVLITDLIFEAASSSSLINGNNYALWVDSNDDGVPDTILQKGQSAQSNQITFDKITGGGYVVPKQKSVIFEVHADISASISGTNPVLSIRFDTGATFIQAEQVNDDTSLFGIQAKDPSGTAIATNESFTNGGATAAIQVLTQYATLYTLRSQGDLYVTLSTTPVKSRQLPGGALGEEILRLQFHAEYEDIEVTDLVFTGSGKVATGTFAKNVERLELYKLGATSSFASATTSCEVGVIANSMCVTLPNGGFIVPRGSNTVISVRPRMNSDWNGAVSGTGIAIRLDITPSTSTGSVRARGLLSSIDIAANDADATAEGEVFIGVNTAGPNAHLRSRDNVVVLSKITSIISTDPSPNGTAIPSGTERAIAQFKFSTAALNNGKVAENNFTLSGVIFNVNATNVELGTANNTSLTTSTFKLYNILAPGFKATCTGSGGVVANSPNVPSPQARSGSSLTVTCRNIAASVANEITPGSDATFVLEANVSNTKISSTANSTLQVSLQGFSDIAATTFHPDSSHLIWADKENASATTFLWIEYPTTSVNGVSYQA